ncbi:Proteinase inhibitor I25, cystatin [Cynara cardunculus var. scolymus]|uniref:Proteinase inhibitor I25, cystatin n=1 Tax=Cynara cardunculus var. scolymus TaxID=59895 RepID=A0A103XT14_CYNCS|nr:Proteinase inhibitor I25, cystatin [Cynara cardunculus var. scolymus]
MTVFLLLDSKILDNGITPLDPNNPEVVANAKFAVEKHNEDKKEHLVFVKVVRAESKSIAGITYNLIFAAKNGSAQNLYHAFVVIDYVGQKQLFSFDRVM